MPLMAIPAIKGVIIVGGIAIAVGVALSEHEPFRQWADQTWRKTNKAFDDFIDEVIPEARQRQRRLMMNAPWSEAGRGRGGWPFEGGKRRGSPSPSAGAERGAGEEQGKSSARDGSAEAFLRKRRRESEAKGDDDAELNLMSARVLSDEAILEKAAHDSFESMDRSERAFLEDMARAQRASLEEEQERSDNGNANARSTAVHNDSASSSSSIPVIEPRANPKNIDQPPNPTEEESARSHTPIYTPTSTSISTATTTTQPGTPHSITRSENGLTDDDDDDDSLDVVSTTSQFTPPGSDMDVLEDDGRSDAGTETMSHVSRDLELEEVRSLASSWSQVSDEAGFALRDGEVR